MGFRKWAPYAVGTVFVVFATDFWSNRPIGRRLRVENVRQVTPGMTRPEVEQLLGGPPGSYPSHRGYVPRFSQLPYTIRPGGLDGWTYVGNAHRLQFEGECWKTDTCDYTFYFEGGRAMGYFHEHLSGGASRRAGYFLGDLLRLPPSSQPNTPRRVVVLVLLGVSLLASIDLARRERRHALAPSAA